MLAKLFKRKQKVHSPPPPERYTLVLMGGLAPGKTTIFRQLLYSPLLFGREMMETPKVRALHQIVQLIFELDDIPQSSQLKKYFEQLAEHGSLLVSNAKWEYMLPDVMTILNNPEFVEYLTQNYWRTDHSRHYLKYAVPNPEPTLEDTICARARTCSYAISNDNLYKNLLWNVIDLGGTKYDVNKHYHKFTPEANIGIFVLSLIEMNQYSWQDYYGIRMKDSIEIFQEQMDKWSQRKRVLLVLTKVDVFIAHFNKLKIKDMFDDYCYQDPEASCRFIVKKFFDLVKEGKERFTVHICDPRNASDVATLMDQVIELRKEEPTTNLTFKYFKFPKIATIPRIPRFLYDITIIIN